MESAGGATIKTLWSAISSAIGSCASTVHHAICNASIGTLLRYGVVIGISAVTIRFIIRYLRSRKKLFYAEENKSLVDRALESNFADARKQQELHPLMKKVKNTLRYGLSKEDKNKCKKAMKRSKNKYDGYLSKLSRKKLRKELPGRLSDIHDFLMEEEADQTYYGCNLAEFWREGFA